MAISEGRSAPTFTYDDTAVDYCCAVCLDPWFEPVALAPCSHVYCRQCAQRLVQCPTCRADIAGRDQAPANVAAAVGRLAVTCSCGWTGQHAERPAHRCAAAGGAESKAAEDGRVVFDVNSTEFVQCLRSIQTDGRTAVCVNSFIATVPLRGAVSPMNDTEVSFRVVAGLVLERMSFGFFGWEPGGSDFASAALGSLALPLSVGLQCSGRVGHRGQVVANFHPRVRHGDLVTLRIARGVFSFQINGSPVAVPFLESVKLGPDGLFVFGVSLAEAGAAVSLGAEPISAAQRHYVADAVAAERSHGAPRFFDVCRSVCVSAAQTAALAIQSDTTTTMTQLPVPLGEAFSAELTVMRLPPGSAMRVGFAEGARVGPMIRAVLGTPPPSIGSVGVDQAGAVYICHGHDTGGDEDGGGGEALQAAATGTGYVADGQGCGNQVVSCAGAGPLGTPGFAQGDRLLLEVDAEFHGRISVRRHRQATAGPPSVDSQPPVAKEETGGDGGFADPAVLWEGTLPHGALPAYAAMQPADRAAAITAKPTFRLAVSMTAKGQAVRLGLDASDNADEFVERAEEKLIRRDETFVDALLSISCDVTCRAAVAERDFPAALCCRTVHTIPPPADADAPLALAGDVEPQKICAEEFVVLHAGHGTYSLRVGVVAEAGSEFSHCVIGERRLAGSIGLTSKGKVVASDPDGEVDGRVVAEGLAEWEPGTRIMAALFGDRHVAFWVNDEPAGRYALPGAWTKYRIAVSVPEVGQAIAFTGHDGREAAEARRKNPGLLKNVSVDRLLPIPDSPLMWVDRTVPQALMTANFFRSNLPCAAFCPMGRWACGVTPTAATLVLQSMFNAATTVEVHYKVTGAAPSPCDMSVGIVELGASVNKQGQIGVVGSSDRRGAIGYFAAGNIQHDGATIDVCRGFVTGDVVSVRVSKGQLTFRLNGVDVSEQLHHIKLEGMFRFAASLTGAGQSLYIMDRSELAAVTDAAGRGNAVAEVPMDIALPTKTFMERVRQALRPRFIDCLRSVECDNTDEAAVCVSHHAATLQIAPAFERNQLPVAQTFYNVRLESAPQALAVGCLDPTGANCGDHSLGTAGLRRSVALRADGAVLRNGQQVAAAAAGRGFADGDSVRVVMHPQTVEFYVNPPDGDWEVEHGTAGHAVQPRHTVDFSTDRFVAAAASLTQTGQCLTLVPGKLDEAKALLSGKRPREASSGEMDILDTDAPRRGVTGWVRFWDTSPTVDCCTQDLAAACKRSRQTTVALLSAVDAAAADVSFHFFILRLPRRTDGHPAAEFRFGVFPHVDPDAILSRESDTPHFDGRLLGDFPESVGLSSSGWRVYQSGVADPPALRGAQPAPLAEHDMVSINVRDGHMSFSLNGNELPFTKALHGKVSVAASFSRRGQMVCLSAKPTLLLGELNEDTRAFIDYYRDVFVAAPETPSQSDSSDADSYGGSEDDEVVLEHS